MGRKPRTRKIRIAKRSDTLSSILTCVVLLIMGMVVADNINPVQEDVTSSLVFSIFLIAINVGLFQYMGLLRTFQRTPRIRYWNLKHKSMLALYLFLLYLMIGKILALVFFFYLLYTGIRSVVNRCKSSNAVLPSLISDKRASYHHIAIKKIDQMDGKEFELFLAELFNGMNYETELTSHNDYGIDIIIKKDDIATGIQAKCYGEGRTIGVEAVNQVCGGAGVHKVKKKMVITNRYFTKNAKISAKANNIKLIDRDELQFLIKENPLMQIREQRRNFSFSSFLNRKKISQMISRSKCQ